MEVTTSHQIQVKTKTNRHQLYEVWLDVESARHGSATVSARIPGTQERWRIPRTMISKTRLKGSTNSGITVLPSDQMVEVVSTQQVAQAQGLQELKQRVDSLEEKIAALSAQLEFAMAALDGAPSPVGY